MLVASRTLLWLGLWLCAAQLTPLTALALELAWHAPSVCPGAAEVRARLDKLLGPKREPPQDLRATLNVQPDRSGYKLTLALDGSVRGTRELSGPDCSALTDTAVWLVAVAIDPALSLAPANDPEPDPALPSPPPPPEPPPPAPPPPPRAAPWVLHAAPFAGLLYADLPRTQADLGLALGVARDWWSTELRATVTVPSDAGMGPGSARLSTQSLGVAACAAWGELLRVGPCAGIAAYRTEAEPRGLLNARIPEPVFWAQLNAGVQLALHLRWPVEPMFEAGVGIPVSPKPRFALTAGVDQVEATRLSAYARVGLRFRWPISPARGSMTAER